MTEKCSDLFSVKNFHTKILNIKLHFVENENTKFQSSSEHILRSNIGGENCKPNESFCLLEFEFYQNYIFKEN